MTGLFYRSLGLLLSFMPSASAQSQPAPRTGEPREASQIFATTCGWCHSKGGLEAGKGPKLAGTQLSDAQIIFRIKRGRPGFMPGFEGTFSDAEIDGLVAYIRQLKP